MPVVLLEIPPEDFEHGRTRNVGAAAARGRHVAFLTHDATPLPGWLDALADDLERDPSVAGVFSRHVPRRDTGFSAARAAQCDWPCGRPFRAVRFATSLDTLRRRPQEYAFYANTSACLRRSVWGRMPFREGNGEDVDWALRVLAAGYKVVYEPASRVHHCHDGSLTKRFRENFDHHVAMRRLFGKAVGRPAIAFLGEALGGALKDDLYRRFSGVALGRRLLALPGSLAWHIASAGGAYCGNRYRVLPRRVVQSVSLLPPADRY
jgi:rhamnosyltransferase